MTPPCPDRDDRLIEQGHLSPLHARGEDRPPAPAGRAPPNACGVSNSSDRPFPRPLAVYIAMSALRSSSRRRVGARTSCGRDARCSPRRRLLSPRSRTVSRIAAVIRSAATVAESHRSHPRSGRRIRRRPAGRRCRTCGRRTPSRHGGRDEQAVARRVAKTVVDGLEVVEIEEQHGQPPRRTRCARSSACVTRSKNSARLASPGERIVERLVRQLRLERLPLADVARVDDDAAYRRLVQQVGAHRLDRQPPPITMANAPLGRAPSLTLDRSRS